MLRPAAQVQNTRIACADLVRSQFNPNGLWPRRSRAGLVDPAGISVMAGSDSNSPHARGLTAGAPGLRFSR